MATPPPPDPNQRPGLAIVRIDRDHQHYAGSRRLRYEVLRRPLGMPLGSEENPKEAECWHWVALDSSNSVVGAVMWMPSEQRLLQMAVDARVQKLGIGRLLVNALERDVAATADQVILHARDLAIGFYERLGYTTYGEPYLEVGIPHRHMQKKLSQ